MSVNDITVSRDKESDVLYVLRKDAKKNRIINLETAAGFTVRVDKDSHLAIGFIIENFSKTMKHLKDHNDFKLMEEFDAILEVFNASHLMEARA